jgi:protein O-GlcNAc transferase
MGDYRDLLREGLGLQQAGQFEAAAIRYRAVLAILTEEPNATYLLGVTLHQMRRPDEAIPLLERAIVQRPDFADAHNNLGEALRAAKRPADAMARYERALALAPGHPAYLANLSHARLAGRDNAGAIEAARQAIAAEAGLAPAHQALGNALLESGEIEGARAALETALRLLPGFEDAAANLALLEAKYGDATRAIALFETLPAGRIGIAQAWARAHARSGAAEAAQRVRLAAVENGRTLADVKDHSTLLFEANHDVDDPAALGALHRRWGERLEALVPALPAHARLGRGRGSAAPLRVGFVSNDFRRHSCGHFLLPLFGALDPARIAIVGYSDTDKPDDITARLAARAAEWHETRGLDDDALARRIQADGLDVLVDLGGHTVGSRLSVFAARPCATQVSWLGYANTTGLTRIDWRLTDEIADPPGQEAFHTERLWRLPGGFLRFAMFGDEVAPARRARSGGFRFGCFNALDKITPACWAAWVAILRALPESTLRLKAFALKEPATMRAWRDRAAQADIGARVLLVPFIDDEAAHLAQYDEIDLALDTAPYGGTTTTCEALWSGVPVLTLAGARHAGRVGASLLARVPDSGVVVDDWAAYRDAAIDLARDAGRYDKLAKDLAARVRSSDLADGRGLANAMTEAFAAMTPGR